MRNIYLKYFILSIIILVIGIIFFYIFRYIEEGYFNISFPLEKFELGVLCLYLLIGSTIGIIIEKGGDYFENNKGNPILQILFSGLMIIILGLFGYKIISDVSRILDFLDSGWKNGKGGIMFTIIVIVLSLLIGIIWEKFKEKFFEKHWEIDSEVGKIRIENSYNLNFDSIESLYIDNILVSKNILDWRDIFSHNNTIHGTIKNKHGREVKVEGKFRKKYFGIKTGCIIFIDREQIYKD